MKARASKVHLAKEIGRFLSRHITHEEAYDFDIKLGKIDIPDSVRLRIPEDRINEIAQMLANADAQAFTDHLKIDFPWIKDWSQEGRSGGWLTLIPGTAVLDGYGNIDDLKLARNRLKDLDEIKTQVEEGVRQHIAALESEAWWEEVVPSPHPFDWSPES